MNSGLSNSHPIIRKSEIFIEVREMSFPSKEWPVSGNKISKNLCKVNCVISFLHESPSQCWLSAILS